MPVYLGIVFLLHAWLGMAALVAGLVLVTMTALHGYWMAGPVQDAMKADQKAAAAAAQSRRQIEVLAAMGMVERLRHRWQTEQDAARSATLQSSDTAALASSFSKTVRLAAQSLILGVGAYLVIQQEMTPGAMIAASIIFARAFAPLEQVTAHWRSLSEVRVSLGRLKAAVGQHESERVSNILPAPKATLGVSELAVAPPNGEAPTLTDIAFDPETENDKIRDAATLADAHELIVGFPQGSDTIVGIQHVDDTDARSDRKIGCSRPITMI